jgi:hypothetical protein
MGLTVVASWVCSLPHGTGRRAEFELGVPVCRRNALGPEFDSEITLVCKLLKTDGNFVAGC